MSEAMGLFASHDVARRTRGRGEIHSARSRSGTRIRRHTTAGIGDTWAWADVGGEREIT